MGAHRYTVWNSAMATTAAQASVSTGTAIKTMLQLSTPSSRKIDIISWGFTIDDTAGADGIIELIQSDVAATGGTAHVAAGLQPLDPSSPASLLTVGTGNTGYTFGTEGTITATRAFDAVALSSTTGESPYTYAYQFLPDERPMIAVSSFLRVRATVPTTAVDIRCWVRYSE